MNSMILARATAWLFCLAAGHAVTLDSMSYTQGHGVCDDAGNPHGGPHWTPSSSWPHLYVRNSTLRVSVNCTVPPTQDWYLIQFRGLAPDGLVLQSGSIWIPGSANPLSFMFYADSGAGRLPNYVIKYDPFSIAWQHRTRPHEYSPWSAYSDFGISATVLYLTLSDPATSPLYRTVVENACKNGGASTPEAAIDYTWLAFAGTSTKTWDGIVLYYYRPQTTFWDNPVSLHDLLSVRTAQCAAWMLFFESCLGVHGLTSERIQVLPQAPPPYTNDNAFLIKNWRDDYSSLPPPYIHRVTFPSGDPPEMYPPTVGLFGDLRSRSGVAGQGSSTPSEKLFDCHFILRYGTTYYDPSYGRTYASELGMENTALWGYNTGFPAYDRAREKSGQGDLVFRVWSP